MAWSSRLDRGPRTTRAIATVHTWQFINKQPSSRATPENSPSAVDGFSLWFCSNCDAKRESYQSTKGACANRAKYRAGAGGPWVSKCPPCERKATT